MKRTLFGRFVYDEKKKPSGQKAEKLNEEKKCYYEICCCWYLTFVSRSLNSKRIKPTYF